MVKFNHWMTSSRGFKLFFWVFLAIFTLFIFTFIHQFTTIQKCVCNLDHCECEQDLKKLQCQNNCKKGKCNNDGICICNNEKFPCNDDVSRLEIKLIHPQEDLKILTILIYCIEIETCKKNINYLNDEEIEVLVFGKSLDNLNFKQRRNLFIFKGDFDLIASIRYASLLSNGKYLLILNPNDEINQDMLNYKMNEKSIYLLKKININQSINSLIIDTSLLKLLFESFSLDNFLSIIQDFESNMDFSHLTIYHDKKLKIEPQNKIKIMEWNEIEFNKDDDKIILFVSEKSLHLLPETKDENVCTIILYENENSSYYEDRHKINSATDLIFTTKSIISSRLHVYQRKIFLIDHQKHMIDPSLFYCNIKLSKPKYNPNLPPLSFPYLQIPYSLHIGLQVDHFDFPGGLERVVAEVAINLKNNGFRVTLFNLGRIGPPHQDIRSKGFQIIDIPESLERNKIYKENIQKLGIHIINAHYSTYGNDIAKELNVPFIQTIHNEYTWLNDNEIKRFKDADRNTYAYFCVSSTSSFYSDFKLGLNVKKMILIRNGVDEERFNIEKNCPKEKRKKIRKELGLSKETFSFLQVGSLVPIKSPQFSIQAMKKVVEENPNSKLFIIGKGMDRDFPRKLQLMIYQNKLMNNVKILGHRTDVPCLLSSMNALLHPSILEGWCLAIAEGVYINKPVIVADTGGSKEFVNKYGVEGSIVLKPPYESILNANLNQIANSEQPEYVNRIAEAMNKLIIQPKMKINQRKDVKEMLKSSYIYQVYGKLFQYIHLGKSIESLKDLTRINYE